MKKVYVGLRGDIIHPGIINIINEASKYGDIIAGVLTDKAVSGYRDLPILSFEQRKQIVGSLKGVTEVVEQDEWSYVPNLLKYKPDYIIHGDDWKSGSLSQIREEVYEAMEKLGGQVIEIPYTTGFSASEISKEMEKIGTTPVNRLMKLKRLIQSKPIVRILEAHSGLAGLIIENLEITKDGKKISFDGMWSSSLTDSTSKGKPDIEVVDLTTRLQDLTNILECTTKPIIFDGDTGGKAEHFVYTVKTLERNGVSAVIIEDKVGLKKNSLFGTEVKQQLASVEEFCEKIHLGKNAQVTNDFMIIARLESLIAGFTVDDALERAKKYIEAGADGVMIHSKEKTGDDIKEFCARFRAVYKHIPIILVPTTYNKFTESELASWGANVIIYANHMLRASYPAMKKAAESILEHSRSLEADSLCMPIKEILELIPGGK